ncbi:unnamed protein product [Lathyrus sativus]|nr:unnamed protein product [Lathyrus sativus]
MDSSFNARMSPSKTLSLNDCLTIIIDYTHLIISSTSNDPKNLTFRLITPNFHKFEIPLDILCNNNDINNQCLYEIFEALPNYLMNLVIRDMRDCARKMVQRGKVEAVNLALRWVNSRIGEEDEFDLNHAYHNDQQIVGLSSNLEVDITSDSKDQCSICFEEFCNGSETELFYTKCSHIFHKMCIAKWICQCVTHTHIYSCPLCRCEIM